MPTTPEDIDRRFAHHPPRREGVAELHSYIRARCASLAHDLNRDLPECREKSLALTHLEEVMMWANAAVARVLNYLGDEAESGAEQAALDGLAGNPAARLYAEGYTAGEAASPAVRAGK
jgi:hypothetical protein